METDEVEAEVDCHAVYSTIVYLCLENGLQDDVPDMKGPWDDWDCLLDRAEQRIRCRHSLKSAEDLLYSLYSMVFKIAPSSEKESFAKRNLWLYLLSYKRESTDDVELQIRILTCHFKIPALKIASAHYHRLAGMPICDILKFLGALSGEKIEEAKKRFLANGDVSYLCGQFLYPNFSCDIAGLYSQDGEAQLPKITSCPCPTPFRLPLEENRSLGFSANHQVSSTTSWHSFQQQSHLQPMSTPTQHSLHESVQDRSGVRQSTSYSINIAQPPVVPVVSPILTRVIGSAANMTTINGRNYIILRRLGVGGSSQVYSAYEDSEDLTEVAIKCIPMGGMSSDVIESYKNEVHSLMNFEGSPYIIQLLNHEIRPDYIFIVLEKGSVDLNEIMRAAPLAMEDTIFYWKKMLRCVAEIHKHRIIHLDLKPGNFLLVGHELKLIDLGISRRLVDDRTNVTLLSHQGTLNYMSPEQLPNISDANMSPPKVRVTTKSDIWSLGVILYVMLTGHTPWHQAGNGPLGRMLAILTQDIPLPPSSNRCLVQVTKLCLNRDSNKRPSAEELLSINYFDLSPANASTSSSTLNVDDTTIS